MIPLALLGIVDGVLSVTRTVAGSADVRERELDVVTVDPGSGAGPANTLVAIEPGNTTEKGLAGDRSATGRTGPLVQE